MVPYTYTCGPACGPADNLAAYDALNTEFLGLNAFVSLNAQALAQAKQADILRRNGDKRPLLGIPIAIKDNIAVANLGLTNALGNFTYLPYQPATNGNTAQKLIDAGAIVIGKNNMHEFAASITSINFAFGPARNAYDAQYMAGGSSGGGAASVGARLISAAIGNDIGGSVRTPAAFNGIIGYRPSYGRYPSNFAMTLSWADFPIASPMATDGVMARSVDDVVLLDSAIAGPQVPKVKLNTKLNGLRLGIPEAYYQGLEPTLKAVVDKSLKRLEQKGAVLIRTPTIPGLNPGVSIPELGFLGNLQTLDDVWLARIIAVFQSANDGLAENTGIPNIPDSPDVAAQTLLFNFIYNSTFPNLASAQAYNDYLLTLTAAGLVNYKNYFSENKLDAIVYPTARLMPKTIHDVVVNGGNPFTNGVFDFTITLTDNSVNGVGAAVVANSKLSPYFGTPSLSVPIGLTTDTHLPVGMQIEGLPGGDSRVLEVGSAFEKLFKIPAPHSAP